MTPRSPRQSLRAIFTVGFFTVISLTLLIPFLASKQAKSQTFSPAPNLLAVTNQKRVALVIGNSNYQAAIALANPGNDAEDVAQTLGELGFEVIKVIDGSQKQMDAALERFSAKLSQGTVGVFFYAGHGVQVNGENYLIPINAQLAAEKDVVYETLPVGKVQNAMGKTGTTSIIILDACRDNPFSRRWYRTTNSRGLAPIEAFSSSYIAFATAPGSVAADGEGRNGTFTSFLLKHLKTPNLPIENLFKKVRNEVLKATKGKQQPWDSSSLTDEFFFNPVSTATDTPPTPAPITTPHPPVTAPKPVTPPTNPPVVATANRPPDFISKLIPYPLEKISLAYTSKDANFIGISSDGKILATHNDKIIDIWNLTNGKNVNTLPYESKAYYHLSPDGETLVEKYKKEVKILSLKSGKILYTLNASEANIVDVIIPNTKTIVTVFDNATIIVGNLITGKSIQTIKGFCVRKISSIAEISGDSKTLAVVCKDNAIQIWNLETEKLISTLVGHTDIVNSVGISRDGKILVSSSTDGSIKIWNLSTSTLVSTLNSYLSVNTFLSMLIYFSIEISPDMKTIINRTPEGIKIWDINTRQLILNLSKEYYYLKISANNTTVVVRDSSGKIDVWKALY
ncbi:caspase family protein [Nostoc linckia FACHB-104]|nr:caspase family protein [Nostoc linckia FACHB-104]